MADSEKDDELAFPEHLKGGFSFELQLQEVDPDLLSLLTGGWVAQDPKLEPEFSVEVWSRQPVKRTFWQWLRRSPVEYTTSVHYIPNARFRKPTDDG